MLRVALRNARAGLLKLAMSIIAVALGTSFIVGTFALRDVLSSTFNDIVDTGLNGATYVRPNDADATGLEGGGGDRVIPAALAQEIAPLDGVAAAIPDYSGTLVLVGSDGTAVGGGGGAPTLAFAYLADDPSLRVTDGVGPASAADIALDTGTAESAGLAIGDETTVIVAGQIREVTVTGLVTFDASLAGASLVLLDGQTAMDTFAPDGMVSTIAVYAADSAGNPVTYPDLDEDTEKSLTDAVRSTVAASDLAGDDFEVVSGTTMRDDSQAQIDSMLGFLSTFLLVFAGIALFVGGFVIANTFAMTVRQKQREFAMLRAIGASPGQVFLTVTIQAVMVGIIGGAVGIAGGYGLVHAIRAVFNTMGMELTDQIPVTVPIIALGLATGVLVSAISAAIPARRAALTAPVEAMREEAAPVLRPSWWRIGIGTVLALGGAGMVTASVVIARNDDDASMGALLGYGAALVIIGLLILSPILAKPVVHITGAPFAALFKPLGSLARGNVIRNPKRTANTASALMIGMALVAAASVLASSVTLAMKAVVAEELAADVIVQSQSFEISADAVTDLNNLDETAEVNSFVVAPVSLTWDAREATDGEELTEPPAELNVGGTEENTFPDLWFTDPVAGDLAAVGNGELVVQESTADTYGWELGDTITVTGSEGSVDARIGAIINSQALGIPLLMSTDLLADVAPANETVIVNLLINAADGVSDAQLRDALAEAAKPYYVLSIYDQEEFTSMLASQVNQILTILYALLGLSIVIAVLGIVNTLALSVIERTREIGLMRAVGLGKGQLTATIMIESVLTALFGTLLGLGAGVAIAAAMPSVFANQGFTELSIPWGALMSMVGLAVIVGVLAAVWPAWRATRMPVLEAIAAVE
ncbi:ABC transporter permease [Jonesia quinghaiensis]|uniref:ABC transporter permease n=1 Tax=Jonesia quinghaiensis TaxID=262806 RepID=UPI0003FBE51E|nr:FtsX-like permease family protein [Jonesia quinghaiensis]